jgi:hypothetical protein
MYLICLPLSRDLLSWRSFSTEGRRRPTWLWKHDDTSLHEHLNSLWQALSLVQVNQAKPRQRRGRRLWHFVRSSSTLQSRSIPPWSNFLNASVSGRASACGRESRRRKVDEPERKEPKREARQTARQDETQLTALTARSSNTIGSTHPHPPKPRTAAHLDKPSFVPSSFVSCCCNSSRCSCICCLSLSVLVFFFL